METEEPKGGYRWKRGPWKWLKRGALSVAVLLVALLVAAWTFQAYTSARAIRDYPPPGQMVDVGGYRMHVRSAGSGSPTVVLDAGLGGCSVGWREVQPKVAEFTRVISYDRAGLGWSSRSPLERTSEHIVQELSALLREAGIPGPYVLVGHSFGGSNMRLYAHRHPEQVLGLVLVDASHEDQSERVPDALKRIDKQWIWMAKIGRRLAHFGIARLLLPPPGPIPLGDPAAIERAAKLRALSLRTSHVVTMCEEMINIPRSDKQLEGCRLPPDLPLAVLSASHWEVGAEVPPEDVPKALEVWKEVQQELASQSTNSFHFVVPDCGHDIPTQRPQVIVEAIRAVVEAARTGSQVLPPQQEEQEWTPRSAIFRAAQP
jgi:pimeloyl-ACP methyl ester carboxylesterase